MTQELRTIRLFGHLGKRFGKVHHYMISSPAEAVKALSCTIPGFRDYVGGTCAGSGFRVLVGGEAVGVDQLGEISGGQEIRIVPVVRGAKSALGQVILGAVLIAAAFFVPGSAPLLGKFLMTMGTSMVLGGIAGLLASPPNPLSYGAGEDNRPSNYLFNGSNQATPSGGPVPVLYGRLEIPLTLISGSITPEQSAYGNSQLGMLGDGNGTWSGDGNTVPRAASIRGEATTTTVETAKMMFALSEGPCAGLADGLKSIKFDGTPVQAPDGSFNFKGVSFALVNGTSTQQAIPGFPATETEHSAGGEIKTSQPQYITVNDLGTSLVRVKIAFQALQKIDTASGKPVGTSVQIAIDVQASGGSYVAQTLHLDGVISDLSSGPTARAFSVPLSGTGPWTIRVRRITADSTDTYLQNKTYLGSYTEVKDGKLRNPWTAKLAVALNAKEFASIPKVTVDYLGRSTLKVPVNYDPATRVYTGVWNGTFKEAWTDNPVWCFYDMATHGRYGAGRYLAAEGLDIWTLYQIAQFCDGLVSSGKGAPDNLEPRYRFNAYFTKDEEAFKVLAHMISVARSQLYYGGSIDRPATALTAIQDVESTPTALFSPSNVIGGRFSYSGTPRKTRYTEVTVWWNDPAQAYKLVPVLVVADPAYVARYGVQSYETVAFGATSKGQAIREGRRILLTNLLEQEIVSFSSGMEGIVAYPGGLVQIQDPGRDQKRQGGRLKEGCTATSLILDGSVTLAPATAYTAWVTMPDGTVLSRAISTGAGTVSTVTIAALPSAPAAEAQWQITPTATAPTRWRIIGVKEVRGDEAISYETTAIANAPEKYPLIDQCGTITVVDPETPSTFAPVTGLSVSSKTSWSVGKATISLSAQWTMPTGATGAVAWVSIENGPWQEMYVSGSSATSEISGIGSCRVRVVAQYRNGSSAPTEITTTVFGVQPTTPASLTITKVDTRPPIPDPPDPLIYRDPADELRAIIHPPITGEDPTVINPTYLTFAWTHSDANVFALKGFRIVVFTGTDPNDTMRHIREPYETNAAARGSVVTVHVYETSTINAAIQAIYLDGNESSWRLISGTIAADPDTIAIPTREVINVLDERVTTALTPSVVADGSTAQFLYTGPTVTCEDWRGVWTLSPAPRTNLIKQNKDYSNAVWAKYGGGAATAPVVTVNAANGPDGTLTADRITFNRGGSSGSDICTVTQNVTGQTSGIAHSPSIWLKSNTGANQQVMINWAGLATGGGGGSISNVVTVTPEWQRFSCSALSTATTLAIQFGTRASYGDMTLDILAWESQLEAGTAPTPNIPTGASAVTVTDYTVSNGLATLSPAPLQGAILRGVSSNASQQASLAAPAIVTDHAAISLPSATYPAGRLVYQTAGTPAGTFWQVNAAGTGWQTPNVGVAQIIGQLIAGQIAAGAINATHLAAALAIVGEIKSGGTGAVYNGTSSVMSTLGFKIAGTPFTAMGADGATHQVSADFSGPVMIAGRKAATLVSRIIGGRVVLTTGTSWTVPDGVTKLTVTLCGGGAGGNGGNAGNSGTPSTAAPGGFAGGGGGVIKFQVDVASGDTLTYSIGAKGTGGQGGQTSGALGETGTAGGATSFTFNGITAKANGGSLTVGGSVVGAYNGVTITSGQTYQMSNGFLIAGGSGGGLTAPSTGADSKAGGANGTGTGYGRGSGASALSSGKVGANGPPAPNNSNGYAAVSAGATEYGAGGPGGGGGRGFADNEGKGGNGGDGGPGVIIIEY